jgi:hypothetical protein
MRAIAEQIARMLGSDWAVAQLFELDAIQARHRASDYCFSISRLAIEDGSWVPMVRQARWEIEVMCASKGSITAPPSSNTSAAYQQMMEAQERQRALAMQNAYRREPSVQDYLNPYQLTRQAIDDNQYAQALQQAAAQQQYQPRVAGDPGLFQRALGILGGKGGGNSGDMGESRAELELAQGELHRQGQELEQALERELMSCEPVHQGRHLILD